MSFLNLEIAFDKAEGCQISENYKMYPALCRIFVVLCCEASPVFKVPFFCLEWVFHS